MPFAILSTVSALVEAGKLAVIQEFKTKNWTCRRWRD